MCVCVCVLGNKAEILLLVPHPVPPLLLVPPRVQMQLRLWLCRGKLLDRPSLGREEHHPLGHLGLRASEGEAPARDEVQQALRTRREMGWRCKECVRVRCVSEREREDRENGIVGIFVLVLTCCSCNPSGIPRARDRRREEKTGGVSEGGWLLIIIVVGKTHE